MKTIPLLLGAALTSLLVGCATSPVAMAPVGPNPARIASDTPTGQLEVFSATQMAFDGNEYGGDPSWSQHTDYTIYDLTGKRVRHVGNDAGYFSEAPAVVALPPGEYVVKARARDFLLVDVPVNIKPGLTTRVHLNDQWQPASDTPKSELVVSPAGHPIGWRTPSTPNPIKMD